MSNLKNFVRLNANRARHKVIVFPYAGGSPYAFRDWGTSLAPSCELWGLQLPGRAERFTEPCLSSMASVIDAVTTELPRVVEDCEYVFFGHSNGALAAFASTQFLEQAGERPPRHVFLSGKRPPLGESRKQSELTDSELIQFLQGLGGLPREMLDHSELLTLHLPTIRADMKIGEDYQPSSHTPIATPVSILGGDSDNGTTLELMHGWHQFCSRIAHMELFPGDHFFISRHVARITSLMRDAFRTAYAN